MASRGIPIPIQPALRGNDIVRVVEAAIPAISHEIEHAVFLYEAWQRVFRTQYPDSGQMRRIRIGNSSHFDLGLTIRRYNHFRAPVLGVVCLRSTVAPAFGVGGGIAYDTSYHQLYAIAINDSPYGSIGVKFNGYNTEPEHVTGIASVLTQLFADRAFTLNALGRGRPA